METKEWKCHVFVWVVFFALSFSLYSTFKGQCIQIRGSVLLKCVSVSVYVCVPAFVVMITVAACTSNKHIVLTLCTVYFLYI